MGGWRRCGARDGWRRWSPGVLFPKSVARRAIAGRRCRERINQVPPGTQCTGRCWMHLLGMLPRPAACFLLGEIVGYVSRSWHQYL